MAKRGNLLAQGKRRAGKLDARERRLIPDRLAGDDRIEVVSQSLAEGDIARRLNADSPALVGKFVEEEVGQLVVLIGNALGQGAWFQNLFRRKIRTARSPVDLPIRPHADHPLVDRGGQAGKDVGAEQHVFCAGGERDVSRVGRVPVDLFAPLVVGADSVEVRAVGEGVLRDERHVAPVEVGVAPLGRVGETLGKNHVRRVEAAGVGAAEEDGVLRHLRIDRLAVRLGERRREHVVPVPETEQVPALLVLPPMLQNRPRRQQRQHDQDNHRRQPVAPAIAALIAVHQKQRRQKHHEAERKRACPVIEKKLRLRQLSGPGNHRQRGGHDQP